MKYTDLTEKQRKYWEILVSYHGVPPEDATHFDLRDNTGSTWTRYDQGDWYCWMNGWVPLEHEEGEAESDFVEIPEKPWTDSPQQKVNKIVYDKNAFRKAIEYVCKENPYARPEWKESIPSKVGSWMKELVDKYQTGDIDGTAFTSTAGLTLISYWSDKDELTFELLVDPAISDESDIQLYDPSEVFKG